MAHPKTSDARSEPFGPELFAAMMTLNPSGARLWTALANEGSQFVAERVQHWVSAQSAMLTCKTPADAVQLQAQFMSDTLAQYAATTSRTMELFASSSDALTAASGSRKRRYDDVPL